LENAVGLLFLAVKRWPIYPPQHTKAVSRPNLTSNHTTVCARVSAEGQDVCSACEQCLSS